MENTMEKSVGIILMATFGISGITGAALAWLCPFLLLDKTLATLAGIIGAGFVIFQGLRFRHVCHHVGGAVPVETVTEDKN